jgi:hypothetical protein
MALLTVLFIVFAVTVVAMGLLSRSDMALASGRNLCLRNQSDYLAWAGLEHARAYIQSYKHTPTVSAVTISAPPFTLDSNWYYDLRIAAPSATDPNKYTYSVSSEGYYNSDISNPDNKQARSELYADIVYDPNDGTAVFSSIRRQ